MVKKLFSLGSNPYQRYPQRCRNFFKAPRSTEVYQAFPGRVPHPFGLLTTVCWNPKGNLVAVAGAVVGRRRCRLECAHTSAQKGKWIF